MALPTAASRPSAFDAAQVAASLVEQAIEDVSDLADTMLQSERVALLLRRNVAPSLTADQLESARQLLFASTAVMPVGRVRVDRWLLDDEARSASDVNIVDECFFDRFAVTNRQFQAFVEQGGYEQRTLWHASVWPRVRGFVDATGKRGPRFWTGGRAPEELLDHPVVGVSWFEAEAFARWTGKRLPSDAEWVRAASCPIETGGGLLQRKYPWGDVFERTAANLWSSRSGGTEPVHAYELGESAFGIRQLVGNVWEWTSSTPKLWRDDREVEWDGPLNSLRGGAFDTYFDTQVTCQLRSGDNPLARKHNIGFRCAVNACDLIDEASP